jgi:hypothetical protein
METLFIVLTIWVSLVSLVLGSYWLGGLLADWFES